MIYTARQLEDLWKAGDRNGSVALPCQARLTPLAADWIRQKRIEITYADLPAAGGKDQRPDGFSRVLWWCDGPCGPAKAALMAQAWRAGARVNEIGVDSRRIHEAVRILAGQIKSGSADSGVLLVSSAASAMIFANRCRSLRAVLGTCLDAVEQAAAQVGANVLVIEHPYKTMPQVAGMISRFLRGRRELDESVRKELEALASCG